MSRLYLLNVLYHPHFSQNFKPSIEHLHSICHLHLEHPIFQLREFRKILQKFRKLFLTDLEIK